MKHLIISLIVLIAIIYPQKNIEFENQLFNNTNDEIVETGYSYRSSYSRDNRSVDDTLYYDLPWGAYFYMEPGDVMVTAFQVSADATLKGVSVPVSTGVYFSVLTAGQQVRMRKMLLVK